MSNLILREVAKRKYKRGKESLRWRTLGRHRSYIISLHDTRRTFENRDTAEPQPLYVK